MMTRYLSVALVLGFSVACSADESARSPQQCWTEFRQAVVAGNYDRLRNMTQFPLAVRGAVDGIPAQMVERGQFEAMLNRILDQPMASYEGEKLVTYTMRDLVARTTELNKKPAKTDGQFRVGELVFDFRGGRCRLVQAYLSE